MAGDIKRQVHQGIREGMQEAADRLGFDKMKKAILDIRDDLDIIAEELHRRKLEDGE
jgi:hypothetical protein